MFSSIFCFKQTIIGAQNVCILLLFIGNIIIVVVDDNDDNNVVIAIPVIYCLLLTLPLPLFAILIVIVILIICHSIAILAANFHSRMASASSCEHA